jgi:hypothetical protein
VLLVLQNQTLLEDFGCGDTKGCFAKCSGGQCDFIISWNDTGEHVQFEMKKKFSVMDPSDHWIAVGFSEDKRMVTGKMRGVYGVIRGGQW